MMKNLHEAIYEWLVSYKKNSVKASTYDRLMVSLDLMDKYQISEMPIDALDVSDLQSYVNQLVDDGYALTTIKKQMHLIGGWVSHANLMGFISRPIHKGVKLPSESSVKKHKKEVIAYTHEDQDALKRVLYRGDSMAWYAAIIMMETGMRVGEVLALCWSDIDWRRKAVKISKTVVRLGDSRRCYVQKGAKSYTSNRTIPLSTEAFDLLTFLKETNSSLSDYIFHNKRGDFLSYETLRWWVGKACEEAGVPYYGQHVFRHTFATNCYEKGCDVKVLSKFLGHSDVTITYNVYIHLFGDALEEMRLIIG